MSLGDSGNLRRDGALKNSDNKPQRQKSYFMFAKQENRKNIERETDTWSSGTIERKERNM